MENFNINISKNTLITICIIIIVLIIFRCIYVYYFQGNTQLITEGFDINNDAAKDLLSKLKSTELINNITYNSDSTNKTEMTIIPWTNKIYNMQNPLVQTRPIAFYKPNLTILGQEYYKLGDIVSQDTTYTPNTTTDFTLLIKKTGSDVQLPTDFNLVVNFGNSNINSNYYQYDKYITDIPSFNKIANNLSSCSTAFTDLNKLITDNRTTLNNDLSTLIFDNVYVSIGGVRQKLNYLLGMLQSSQNETIENSITNTSSLILPAGITGYIKCSDNTVTDLGIPNNLDFGQPDISTSSIDNTKQNIKQILPLKQYSNISTTKITFTTIGTNEAKLYLFDFIPTVLIINYLQTLCLNIKTIYDNENNNTSFLEYLKLASSVNDINILLASLSDYNNTLLVYSNNSTLTFSNTPNSLSIRSILFNYDTNTTLLGLVCKIICTMQISYNMTSLEFTHTDIIKANTGITPSTAIATTLVITGFDNTIAQNIPSSMFNITSNAIFSSNINTILPHINNIKQFQTQINSQTIDYFPLQIYRPIAPDGYTSLGHVFCNVTRDLINIKNNKSVACVPSHCVKVMRPWVANDKIFEYNKEGVYWAIYYNPYTGTFISTNTPQLPEGSVCKVVACVAKCTAVDDLQKADDCARKYYNLNQKSLANSKIVPDLVSNQEEEFYLKKLKVNSDSITKLKTRAQQMQIDIDKANIVNREMNKNKLQNYVDTQKTNIDTIMKRLIDDNNKIETNINIPANALNSILSMINNSSTLSSQQKSAIISKIIESQKQLNSNLITADQYNAAVSQALSSCPQYDLTGLVRKDLASDVCYGCDVPK